MKIIIEKLKKEDLKDAIDIYDKNHNLTTNYEKLFSIYDSIVDNPMFHNIVAKVNGEIVGFATIFIHYDIVEELKPFLTIWNFGVKEEYRRKKVGTKMLAYIEDFAKKNDCIFISLFADSENKNAQSFYENLGFSKEIGYFKFFDT